MIIIMQKICGAHGFLTTRFTNLLHAGNFPLYPQKYLPSDDCDSCDAKLDGFECGMCPITLDLSFFLVESDKLCINAYQVSNIGELWEGQGCEGSRGLRRARGVSLCQQHDRIQLD